MAHYQLVALGYIGSRCLGPDARVIQPPALRDTLADRAEQTLRQYRYK
ncbi:MAG: WYL domain-containing protein [Actinomycetota bacterium]|nr:WYL domain-containing protein [Actinomycetota bacterium]